MTEEMLNYPTNTENIEDLNSHEDNTSLVSLNSVSLSEESKALIEQIISETDEQKTRDLTQLFNANQNKKTMVRVNKLNDLLDTITDQALTRFTTKPDEISNKELFDGLKVVQDLIERGQKQVSGVGETPLIQVNQQTNEVNIGGNASTLSRDSRERVKAAVLGLLDNITASQPVELKNEDVIVFENIEEEDNLNGGE
jgi:hypothetical protein